MVVDDTVANLKHVEAQLSGDYEVTLVKSGETALRAVRHRRPDLFLLDVEMPGMNGFELLARLREQPGLGSVPVIFYSTLADPAIQARALREGARDFIVKPAIRDILLYRVALHLKRAAYLGQMEQTVASLSAVMTESFAELINFRYKMTGHSERVPRFCALLGKEAVRRNYFPGELTAGDLGLIVRASPLHDIGNITVPDRVLLKPGPLEKEERRLVEQHSLRGAEILGRFSLRIPTQRFFHYARLIALSHHEAWDGGGYPSGLAENAIPLCGRLAAVADVYDDLTSDRAYRDKMSHDEACRIILREKGRRFDPRIVRAFEAVADELRDAA